MLQCAVTHRQRWSGVINWQYERQTLLLAVGFLTRLPVPPDSQFSEDKLHRATLYFPLVGLLIGVLASIVFLLAQELLGSRPLAVVLGMVSALLLTGGLHEDGLADSADGFCGARQPEDVLRIMKDSRLGTAGVLALIAVLAIKALALVALPSSSAVVLALVWGHGLSRWFAISFLLDLPYVRPEGKSRGVAKALSPRNFLLAGLPLGGLLLGWPLPGWLVLSATLIALRFLIAGWLRRRLGGHTGDVLGGLQQGCEVIIYLAALAATVS